MANHILAIGISNYSRIRSLKYAAKDAKDFYYLFTNNVGDVGYHTLLVDSEATLASIRNALGAELQNVVGANDTFFFFFSGHGALATSQEEKDFSNYLLPFDASDDISNTSISIEYLKGRFSKINCRNKLIIIDSCFSGSINSKAYTQLNIKSLSKVKTFENTISGKGHITFTASKEDEEAIEDIELKNGLFTYYFLEELQNSSHGERIPILSIHAPVTEHVIQRAKDKYSFEQTPTLKGDLEGVLYLPLFKKRLKISPEEIEIPTHPELQQTVVPSFELDIEDKDIRDDINKLFSLVVGSQGNNQAWIIESKRLIISAISKLRDTYEKIFKEVGNDVSKIPESIAKLESNSYYIQLIGCVISAFGNEDLMEDYAEQVGDILGFGMSKSGLTALIDIPEIILVNITYVIGITSLVNDNLDLFCKFLNTKIYDARGPQYVELYKRYDIHYCSSLGGKATSVGDHIQITLDNNTWLAILSPQIEGRKMEYRLQVNFLLGAFCYARGIRLFADYGRYYGTRIMPLVARIRDDSIFAAKVANFLGKEESQLIDFLKEYVKEADYKGSGLWWHSIGPSIFDSKMDFVR